MGPAILLANHFSTTVKKTLMTFVIILARFLHSFIKMEAVDRLAKLALLSGKKEASNFVIILAILENIFTVTARVILLVSQILFIAKKILMTFVTSHARFLGSSIKMEAVNQLVKLG